MSRELRVFRRERPFADARRVGLHHAEDAIHAMRRNARAGAGAARGRVRRGHVRIRAVIDIEKSSLRAFEEDLLPGLQRVVQIDDGVADERRELCRRRLVYSASTSRT